MKLVRMLTPIVLLCCSNFPAFALESGGGGDEGNENIKDLVKYFKNFGTFLGYDVTQEPAEKGTPKTTLIQGKADSEIDNALVPTYFGSIPVVAVVDAFAKFVQGNSPLNDFANTAFKNPTYNTTSGPVTANALIDQTTYLQDPVSQSILDILAVPDLTDCFATNQGVINSEVPTSCTALYRDKVIQNVVGSLPLPNDTTNPYYSSGFNAAVIPQLSSNSLLGPLLYSTDAVQVGENNSGGGQDQSKNPGLTSQSQAQNAANFVRWASALVTPPELPSWSDYHEAYYTAATPINSSTSASDISGILSARTKIFTYFAQLRTYAAQVSVGIGNLYGMVAKRMPIPQAAGTQPTSQALTEFNMATRRIFPQTDSKGNAPNWIEEINKATPATVQKEIAVLLAEINYQLYLNRQQDERLLLTQSIMLIQNGKQLLPDSNLSTKQSVNEKE